MLSGWRRHWCARHPAAQQDVKLVEADLAGAIAIKRVKEPIDSVRVLAAHAELLKRGAELHLGHMSIVVSIPRTEL